MSCNLGPPAPYFLLEFCLHLFSLYVRLQVAAESKDAPGDFAVFVPYPYLGPVAEALKGSKVFRGTRGCFFSVLFSVGVLERIF
jgi:hypothetical protein